MTIIETRHVTRLGKSFTLVMTESVADDVAVYEAPNHVPGEAAAQSGIKYTEWEASQAGFKIPAGKHYRR